VLAAAALMASVNLAQSADLKVGFVKLERLFKEAAPAVKAQKKIEKEFAARDQELQKLSKQARDLQTSLEKEGVTMGESERRDKEQELARLNRDLQRMQRELREDLNLRKNEELAAVLERANKVIQQIAENEKFDLILQEAVYISPRIDITDRVIKALADK
jgi:outer membrane protein